MQEKLAKHLENEDLKKAAHLVRSPAARHLFFEKAYVFYRQQKNEEALTVLEKADESDPRVMELKAQIFYRQERYAEAHDLLEKVIAKQSDEFDEDRRTNLFAIKAKLGITEDLEPSTFEQLYNVSCGLLKRGEHQRALEMLQQAEEKGRAFLAAEGLEGEDIEDELDVILKQKTYVSQKLGKKSPKSPKSAIDVDELEERAAIALRTRTASKKAVEDSEIITGRLRARRRQKKVILPKNLAAKPDPERWLPKQERTAHKRWLKKSKRHEDVGKGTQGGGYYNIDEPSTSAAALAADPPNAAAALQPKKTKKKNKWKN
ncbi:hypothetical protein L596_020043 [Steinernema carpocapsae]|uniref:Signal recognition particle subunit SRP72 n=1 Tax=Steinernema carpocapsae TaxID=34508 RepID=A0A4V6A0S7_STECR|nr:hypothetical protein L596_020043 [Steinernema carpocapsae]